MIVFDFPLGFEKSLLIICWQAWNFFAKSIFIYWSITRASLLEEFLQKWKLALSPHVEDGQYKW